MFCAEIENERENKENNNQIIFAPTNKGFSCGAKVSGHHYVNVTVMLRNCYVGNEALKGGNYLNQNLYCILNVSTLSFTSFVNPSRLVISFRIISYHAISLI